MKGFIEVTRTEDKSRVIIKASTILAVSEYSDCSYIATNQICHRRKTTNYGYFVSELFDEVVAKIKEATE